MKIFICPTTNDTFNHYLLSDCKLTVFTFRPSRLETENTGLDVKAFLSTFGEMLQPEVGLPTGIKGASLSDGLDGLFDCVGKQTLDLSLDEVADVKSCGLLGEGERSDRASWVFMATGQGLYPPPYNRFVRTTVSKAGTARMTSSDGHFTAQLSVPFHDSLVTDEANSLLLKPGKLGYTLSGTDAEPTEITLAQLRAHENGWDPFPTLTLSGDDSCGADGVELTVNLVDADGEIIGRECEVYLKTDSGYLPYNKITLKDGTGKCRFVPLYLSDGDVSTVKAGFKTYSNIVSKAITYNA